MKNKLIILVLFLFSLNVLIGKAKSACLPKYDAQVEHWEHKLKKIKHTEKKIAWVTFGSVGAVNAVFWGSLFYALTDGATIAISIGEGLLFGGVIGAAAVGAVSIPFVAINQILKAHIRKVKWGQHLLLAAKENNFKAKEFAKLYKHIKHNGSTLTEAELASKISLGDEQDLFCKENSKLFSKKQFEQFFDSFYLRQNSL